MARYCVMLVILAAVVAAVFSNPVLAQKPNLAMSMVPEDSMLVVGFDRRPDNPGMIALKKAQNPADSEHLARQVTAMRKAIESFTTLYGVSLDFVKDFDTWLGDQWLLVVPRAEKNAGPTPVFLMESKDAGAAKAALLKFLAPFEKTGAVISDSEVISFKPQTGVEMFAAVEGPVVAICQSKSILNQVVGHGGFTAGSPVEKLMSSLSGSILYAYADPALFGEKGPDDPFSGISLGVWASDNGLKMRVQGLLTGQAKEVVAKAMISSSAVRTVNPAIPSTALMAVSAPDVGMLKKLAAATGMDVMMAGNPDSAIVEALDGTQVSAAITALLPTPSGVAVAMADSDQAAKEKLSKVMDCLKEKGSEVNLVGTKTEVARSGDSPITVAQSGKYILAAADKQSMASIESAIAASGLSEMPAYKETMAQLDGSNVITLYASMAPIQGLGYLTEATGFDRWNPLIMTATKFLEDTQALGLGIGCDSESVSVSLALRGNPSAIQMAGPSMVPIAATLVAALYPTFEDAREKARLSVCQVNLKQLTSAAMKYANDHGGRLPTGAQWKQQIKSIMPNADLTCPDGKAVYAFNANLSGIKLDKVQNVSGLVMFFEASSVSAGKMSDAILPHHGQGNFAWVDGHVTLESSVPAPSKWVPQYPKVKPAKKTPGGNKPAKPKTAH